MSSSGLFFDNEAMISVANWYRIFLDSNPFLHSMRVLRAHRMSGFCRTRLQRERHLSSWKMSRLGTPRTPLARRQSAQQFQVRPLQEDLLDVGMFVGISMRMVWHYGKIILFGSGSVSLKMQFIYFFRCEKFNNIQDGLLTKKCILTIRTFVEVHNINILASD